MGRETCILKKSEEVISLVESFRNAYPVYKFGRGKDFCAVLWRLSYVSQQSGGFSDNLPLLGMPVSNTVSFFLWGIYTNICVYMCVC